MMRVNMKSRSECLQFLEAQRLGHLACSLNDRPYVVPIYYALKENFLYSFSLPGKKIEIMRANPRVAVVVEKFSSAREWTSVIAQGRYEELEAESDREQAWALLSKHPNWWEPGGLKPVTQPITADLEHLFYRIVIEELSCREALDSE
jgi:nitroimidazol reductase NimA-like FMN-containing flavoprotein (pyridoxamine 5'-phosphate oxidase superfamily)